MPADFKLIHYRICANSKQKSLCHCAILFSKEDQERGLFMKLRVILEPSEEGGYTVYVPSLPGCISEGQTRQEALLNIREAIELYLEPTQEDHIPQDKAEVLEVAL